MPDWRAPLSTALLAALCAAATHAQISAAAPHSPSPQREAVPIPENRGAAALYEDLKRLGTTASLMMIVAHPDDEDGGMLTYESRGMGVRTALFTLTRGEGGQNAMSAADYDALGLIRTNELLNAGEYYGLSQQYWGTVADYGFSKTIEEALQQWGHERVLYDAVRAVRLYRPMVVCSVFVGGITDGHGHHQVAGMLAQEVFRMAGDPKVFPDQIAAGLRPWQPLKVYERVPGFSLSPQGMFDYATGKYAPARFRDYVHDTTIEGVPPTNLVIEEGQYDPVLGETYLQIARKGLGEQRSQHEGPNVPLPTRASVAYHLYGARVPVHATETSFFDGIDTTLPGLATHAPPLKPGLLQIDELARKALGSYRPDHPEATAPTLAELDRHLGRLIDRVSSSARDETAKAALRSELEIKREQTTRALAEALGLEVAALATPAAGESRFDAYSGVHSALPSTPQSAPAQVTPGSTFYVRVHTFASAGGVTLRSVELTTPAAEHWTVEPQKLRDQPPASGSDALFRVVAAPNAAPTEPYFSRPSTEQPYYDLAEPAYRNRSFAPYPVTGTVTFDYQGVPIRIAQVVQTKRDALGFGAVYAPLVVTPALSVSLEQPWLIVPLSDAAHPVTIPVRVHATADGAGAVHLNLPQGWQANPPSTEFHLHAGEDASFQFAVSAPALKAEKYPVSAVAETNGKSYRRSYETAGYGALLPYNLYRPAEANVRGIDVSVPSRLKERPIGYVMGTGDMLPEAIAQLGLHADLLSAADLLSGDLARYRTIVVGIRAYAARPELSLANPRLLAWVHGGGTLVVMYQGSEFDHGYAPYPLHLADKGIAERVVDEKAPVELLDPKDALLSEPNRITEADFAGWEEERGHSFLSSWAKEYAAPTETHDPGQDPQRGGLLHASYGSGEYIYVAFALHRQTPAGVPGAYRILANLLSAGAN